MKIRIARPPNFSSIADAFPWVRKQKGILYAWHGAVYNPDGIHVTPSLMAHEFTHSARMNGDPAAWWDRYLVDPAFRFAEETVAHIEEWAYIKAHEPKRAHRRLYLSDIAARLAGPLYGHLTSKAAAIKLLKDGALAPQPAAA